jgi:hypothetical protein
MIRRPMSLQSAQRFEFNEFFSGPQVRPWASDESAQESFCPQPVAPGMPRRLGGLVCWVGCNAKAKRFHEVSNPLVNHLRLLDNVRHVTCRILLWRSLVRLTMQCVAGSCGSCSLPLGHPQGTAGSHGWTRVEDTSSFRPYRTSKVMPGLAGAEHVTEIYKKSYYEICDYRGVSVGPLHLLSLFSSIFNLSNLNVVWQWKFFDFSNERECFAVASPIEGS